MSNTCIFIDTEFTDFTNTDLISIGAVSEHGGHEFYREVSDHRDWVRSGFVNQVVMPLLSQTPGICKPKLQVAEDFAAWINMLPGESVTVVVDYNGDWWLTKELLLIAPPGKPVDALMYNTYLGNRLVSLTGVDKLENYLDCWNDACAIIEDYFVNEDTRQHHALVDARANRKGFVQSLRNALK